MKMPRKFEYQPLARDWAEFPNLNRPIAWAASYTYKMDRMSLTGPITDKKGTSGNDSGEVNISHSRDQGLMGQTVNRSPKGLKLGPKSRTRPIHVTRLQGVFCILLGQFEQL